MLLILYYSSSSPAVLVVLSTAEVTEKRFKVFQADEKYSAERDDLVFKMQVAGLSFQSSWLSKGLLFIS